MVQIKGSRQINDGIHIKESFNYTRYFFMDSIVELYLYVLYKSYKKIIYRNKIFTSKRLLCTLQNITL